MSFEPSWPPRRWSCAPSGCAGWRGATGGSSGSCSTGSPPLERSTLFVLTEQRQASPLAERLGCRLNPQGTVETRRAERTEVPGVFVAGDASKDAQFVIVAAAEGAEAAVAIDSLLFRQDRDPPAMADRS